MDKIKDFISTYKGVLLFFAAMFGANLVWKLVVSGNEELNQIVILGKYDISEHIAKVSAHVAKVTYRLVRLIDGSIYLTDGTVFHCPNGKSGCIAWSCTGIKQMFIFLVIMLCAQGKWRNKLWFIPLGLALCYAINILRTTSLILIIKSHYNLFPLMHLYILKSLFYILMFLIWVAWEEKFKNINFDKKNG